MQGLTTTDEGITYRKPHPVEELPELDGKQYMIYAVEYYPGSMSEPLRTVYIIERCTVYSGLGPFFEYATLHEDGVTVVGNNPWHTSRKVAISNAIERDRYQNNLHPQPPTKGK